MSAIKNDWREVAKEMPDTDTTVLGFNPRWCEPVWPCFYDSEQDCWRDAEGMRLNAIHIDGGPPTHWMHFPEPPQ